MDLGKIMENYGKISIWRMAGLAGLAEKLWKMMEKYRFGEWPGWLGQKRWKTMQNDGKWWIMMENDGK